MRTPKPYTLTRNPAPETLHPKPYTLHPKPYTLKHDQAGSALRAPHCDDLWKSLPDEVAEVLSHEGSLYKTPFYGVPFWCSFKGFLEGFLRPSILTLKPTNNPLIEPLKELLKEC